MNGNALRYALILCLPLLLLTSGRVQSQTANCDDNRRSALLTLKDTCCASFEHPLPTTVTYQTKLKAVKPTALSSRQSLEDSLYHFEEVVLSSYTLDSNGTYLLTLKDPITDSILLARIPSSNCAEGSPFSTSFAQCRAFFNAALGMPDQNNRTSNALLSFKGVGLFSATPTKAANGREISPLTEITQIILPLQTKRASEKELDRVLPTTIKADRNERNLLLNIATGSPLNSLIISSSTGKNLFNAPRAIIGHGGMVDLNVPISALPDKEVILRLETAQSMIFSWLKIPSAK